MDEVSIEGFISNDGNPNARILRNGKSITLHSISPYKEAEKIASKFNPSIKWLMIAGFGLGYIVEYILKNTDYSVIVFEHFDEILEFAKKNRDINSILTNRRIHFIKNSPSNLIDFLVVNSIKELNFYIHRPYFTIFPEIYSTLEGILISYLSKSQINKATLKRFQKVWLKNIIKNSYFYFTIPGIKQIRHNYKGKPAVIVGAGPSLEKNLSKLKDAEDRVIIISTDTALSILQENNIHADFVVSVDPQDKNTLYLLYSKFKDSTLVIDSAASFLSILKYNPDKTILFDTPFPLYNDMAGFWGEKGSLISGGSVSTTAFDLARFFECDPIIFIGQDLAFTQKQTHSKGSILEDFLYFKINRFQTFDNYNTRMLNFSDKIEVNAWISGKDPTKSMKVFTDRKFITFIEWFKREFQFTKARVINSTEGGAFLEGADHLTFEEAIQRYLKEPLIGKTYELINNENISMKYNKILNFIKFTDNILTEINRLIPYAQKAYSASKEAAIFYENQNSKMNKNNNYMDRFFKTMNEFDQELLGSIRIKNQIARFIELTMQAD